MRFTIQHSQPEARIALGFYSVLKAASRMLIGKAANAYPRGLRRICNSQFNSRTGRFNGHACPADDKAVAQKGGASPPNGTTCPFPLIQAGIRLRARDPLGVIDEAQAHLMCECKQEFRARAPSEYRSGDVGDIRLNCKRPRLRLVGAPPGRYGHDLVVLRDVNAQPSQKCCPRQG